MWPTKVLPIVDITACDLDLRAREIEWQKDKARLSAEDVLCNIHHIHAGSGSWLIAHEIVPRASGTSTKAETFRENGWSLVDTSRALPES